MRPSGIEHLNAIASPGTPRFSSLPVTDGRACDNAVLAVRIELSPIIKDLSSASASIVFA
jgi:hypothetical protein